MFSTIKLQIIAGLGLIISILLALIGYKNKKIDKLEEDNEAFEIKDQIRDNQADFKKEALINESLRIKNKVTKKAKLSRRNHLNSL